MADNWKYSTLTNTGFTEKANAISFVDNNGIIDLLQYFGINANIGNHLLMNCHGTDVVLMNNNSKIELFNVRFSDWLAVYETYSNRCECDLDENGNPKPELDSDNPTILVTKDENGYSIQNPTVASKINPSVKSKDMLFRLIPSRYSLSVTQKYIYIDPNFILVFADGKYTKDWHCVDSTLILHNIPTTSLEIYLLKNFDYNIQDETHYYSSEIPEVGFTFNNLRKNQFMEHHLIASEFFIFEGLGLNSYLKYDTINTRHLLQFAKSKFTYKNVITSNNVVQNQSETYEDVIIRKKLCNNVIVIDGEKVPDTKWATDFSLWKGVDDIYSTSNSSSTMFYDQFGHLIDPIAIDWFNRRLAPYGDYDYVEIQHPSNRAYTGEIYFPASDHDPEEHIRRDPENPYRYKYLYETNYKLVYLPNGNPYEYDTYFRKIFETLHMEETVYVMRDDRKDSNGNYVFDIPRIDDDTYTYIPYTKKTENLLLDDILMNKLYGDGDDDEDVVNVLTDLISVQIQSDTSFIRREILTSKSYGENIYKNDLKVEVPKTDSMLVFVDGKYQFSDTYSIDDTDDEKHYIILSDEFAGETPETTQSHIVTVFYYNKNNRANFCNLKFAKNSQNYAENIKNLKNIFNQVALFEHRILHNGNIVTKEYSPIIVYMKYNGSINELNNNLINMEQNNLVDGTSTKSNLIAKAIKLASSIGYGSLCLIKLDKTFINLNDISMFVNDSATADCLFDDGYSYPIDDYPTSLFDLVTLCFYTYDNNDNRVVYDELPLSFLLNNDVFSDFELDAYLFDIFDDDNIASYNVSVDKCSFYENDRNFAVNNLRKNIYMESYNNISSFHCFKSVNLSFGSAYSHFIFSNIVYLPIMFNSSTMIRMCEFRGVLNNFDTVDNNLYYGSIPVRAFIDETLMGSNTLVQDHVDWEIDEDNNVYYEYYFYFENIDNLQIVVTETEFPEDEYGNLIFIENSIDNFTIQENGKIKITYETNSLEDARLKRIELDRCYVYTREQDLEHSYTYDLYRNNVYKFEQEMNRFSSLVFDKSGYLISPDSIDWVYTEFNYPMEEKQISILPLNSDYPAIIGEVYDNNLEKQRIMNLCLNDIIMFDIYYVTDGTNKYHIDISNNVHTFKIGNVTYTVNNITKTITDGTNTYQMLYNEGTEQYTFNLNGSDYTIYRSLDLHRIGSDLIRKSDNVTVNNFDENIVDESIYKYADENYIVDSEEPYNVLSGIPYGGYNKVNVPVEMDMNTLNQWLWLSNNDYVYWILPSLEEDIMKIVVNDDDFIENNIFAFVNGIKVTDDNFVKDNAKYTYRIKNFSTYANERYKHKKFEKITPEEKIVYVDDNDRYTFDKFVGVTDSNGNEYEIENNAFTANGMTYTIGINTVSDSNNNEYEIENNAFTSFGITYTINANKIVTMYDDSIFSKAEARNIFDFAEDEIASIDVVCQTQAKKSKEIVCYNYNTNDIEYCLKINIAIPAYEIKFNEEDLTPYSEFEFTINKLYYIDSRDLTKVKSRTDDEEISITNNKFSYDGITYDIIYNDGKITSVKSSNIRNKYVFPGYYDYDLKRYSLVFVNGLRYKKYTIQDEEMYFNLKRTDKLEIYVFKKFDYNWTDEVRYQQYIDDRYFSVHNMKTLRMI